MNELNTYTSTGIKLLHHPKAITRLQCGYGAVVSVQIAPTSRCNLNCVFCSNANRKKHQDLDMESVKQLILKLYRIGLKTVEWSGGGEPTMYGGINEMLSFCNYLVKQGMISNGTAVAKNIAQSNLDKLSWLRISLNCLDYVDDIDIPKIKGTLGFSYVWNDKTTPAVLKKLKKYVLKFNPVYVRIVPNCQATDKQQKENNQVLSNTVSKMGAPFFYQAKVFQKPNTCYWCYLKPFILHDAWCYPCSSVVLNSDAERCFHEKYRWVRMEDLSQMYSKKIQSFPTENCNHCVFSAQNEMLEDIINPSGMEDFI